MARITDSAGAIVAKAKNTGTVELSCNFCGGHVEADPPDTMWFGYDAFGRQYDGHERCDTIAKAMEGDRFNGELNAFFERLGVAAGDHDIARRVLVWRIKRGG
jgi:hypothetical protein